MRFAWRANRLHAMTAAATGGVRRWSDRVTEPLLLSEASVTFMPPGEHLDGTTAECAHLHLLLACFRASPPPMRLPEVTGRPLPEVLAAGITDPEVFRTGYAIMAA